MKPRDYHAPGYARSYYWRNVDRRRAQARRARKEARVRQACRELGIPYEAAPAIGHAP